MSEIYDVVGLLFATVMGAFIVASGLSQWGIFYPVGATGAYAGILGVADGWNVFFFATMVTAGTVYFIVKSMLQPKSWEGTFTTIVWVDLMLLSLAMICSVNSGYNYAVNFNTWTFPGPINANNTITLCTYANNNATTYSDCANRDAALGLSVILLIMSLLWLWIYAVDVSGGMKNLPALRQYPYAGIGIAFWFIIFAVRCSPAWNTIGKAGFVTYSATFWTGTLGLYCVAAFLFLLAIYFSWAHAVTLTRHARSEGIGMGT